MKTITHSLLALATSIVTTAAPSLVVAAPSRDESIKTLFTQANKSGKGALGPNMYQRPGGRSSVMQGGVVTGPPRDTLFLVAFRSDVAEKLAALDFYVGNHFTTSYAELHNKYLATEKERKAQALKLDVPAFLAKAEMAADARSMARHMLLEQFYMRKFPQATITRANLARGTADAVHEQEYYSYFTQYLAKQVVSAQDYLNLFELQKRFNLTGEDTNASLAKLRDVVASIYDRFELTYAPGPMLSEFKAIRNSIHNYMTPGVVTKLNEFVKRWDGQIGAGEMTAVKNLRSQVAAYYKTDAKTLLTWAKKVEASLPAGSVQTVNALSDRVQTLAQLEALSKLLTASREAFMASRNPDVIHFMVRVNQYLQTQLGARDMNANEDWAARARIALDSAFASGLITSETWFVARKNLETPQPTNVDYVRARIEDFGVAFGNAQELIRETLQPAITDWTLIDRSMEGYVDDVLRSSLLTELDQLAAYLKKHLPAQPGVPYTIETAGEAFGYLVYLPKGSGAKELEKLDKTSIPIFAELPLDLSVTAAIITEQPQTPLSHVNIKSKSRGTPNAYFPNAAQDKMFKDLLAKKALVKITMKEGRITIREATLEEAQAAWAKMRAPVKVDVRADLDETRIVSTKDLRAKDVLRYGAKASNYGEAEAVLGEGTIREALAVPFFYYKQYVDTNMYDANQTISQRITSLLAEPRFQTDRAYMVESLKALQERMRAEDTTVDQSLVNELKTKLDQLYPNQSMKFRSSSNSEDLANFSGAGLYDSYSYDPTKPKKTIQNALRKTWASVWTLRAFDERELFGINHQSVYMAMLVSPSFSSEIANGVAISRNNVKPELGKGMYINTQKGEELVTNPDPTIFPEELLILDREDRDAGIPYTLKYLRYSKLSPEGPLMTQSEVVRLGKYLAKLNNRFREIFDPKRKNPKFAVDIEFKIDTVGGKRGLFIKQCRPYIAD